MLVTAFTWVLSLAIGLISVPVLVLSVQVFAALLPRAARRTRLSPVRPDIAVLVPAHNESAGIAETCRSLRSQLSTRDRLLVVADNCADRTAEVARNSGAIVVERNDETRIGKGYALDYGVRHLEVDPPQILIVVDADCTLANNTLDHLARAAAGEQRPTQAVYTMLNHPGAPIRMRIAEFAGVVKNLVRPLGYRRLGFPCMLMGTGMAFPWETISRANLATGHIVEDMNLGIELAAAGSPPIYCPEAEVSSFFPETLQGFSAQRSRWEHGHMGLIFSEAPKLLARSIRQRNAELFAMALDLAVPPLALLSLLTASLCAVSALFAYFSGEIRPMLACVVVAGLLVTCVAIARWRFARNIVSLSELAFAPLYAALKIPLYLRFAYRKQANWVRSARKGD